MFEVREDPLDLLALVQAVRRPSFGAIVTFLGVVRESGVEGPVSGLEYSAYREMAVAKMREIGGELIEGFGPLEIAAHHRIGRLEIGEASLALAVAAPHRAEAWRAAQIFVDRLKEIVPIWKKDLPLKGGSA